MKKAICLIAEDLYLQEFAVEMKEIIYHTDSRMTFLQKQIVAENARRKEKHLLWWKKVEKYLLKKKLLPKEYDAEKFRIHWDREAGVIYMESKEDEKTSSPSLRDFMKFLTGSEE